MQNRKTWKVHVAKTILDWNPKPDELDKGPQWFAVPGKDFFKRFPHRSVDKSIRAQDMNNLKRNWKVRFTGMTHAEATLMGLRQYFSERNPSASHGGVDHWNALQDSKVAERVEVLIGPVSLTSNSSILASALY